MTTTDEARPAIAPPPDLVGFRRSIAVVIGIDAYSGTIPALKSAVNDATHLAKLLAEQHHYDEVRLITNEQASRAALSQLLATDLAALVGDDGQSRLLFYFAGHGLAAESDDGRPAGYLVPQDATRDTASMLPMADLLNALDKLSCRHLLLVLDCCFAGAIRWSGTRSLGLMPRAKLYRERYQRYVQGRAWQVLTSAAADERASDLMTFGERASATDEEHSPFALALYDGLAGKADLPFDEPYGDGVITATDLAEYLSEQVTLHAIDQQRSQTPQIWELPRHGKGEYVFLVPGTASLDLPPTPFSNPYRGLQPFDEAQSALFAGRDSAANHLRSLAIDLPLIAIVGPSGIGKSSLLRAGLLPLLRADAEQAWEILPPIAFGDTPTLPFDSLALPATKPATLGTRVQAWATEHPGTKLVLPLDQFEQLARWPSDARDPILKELGEALQACPDQLRVVLTMRAADLPALSGSPIAALIDQGRFNLSFMEPDDLRRAIVEPAAQSVMFFEPIEQIEWLVNQVVTLPGGMPLLSLALQQLYQRSIERNADDRTMSRDDWQAVGGVSGALLAHASTIYDQLNEEQRMAARRVLLRLVQVDGEAAAPRTIVLDELEYPDAAEKARVGEVLRQLADARLLVIGAKADGAATLDLAHGALLHDWDKLQTWVGSERPALELRRRLSDAAALWQQLVTQARNRRQRWQAGRRLWSDEQLDQAKAALHAPHSWLNAAEQRFVQASIDHQNRVQFWQRVTRIVVFSVMGLLTIAALILAYAAALSQESADNRALVADAQTQLEQGNTGDALALAMASVAQSSHEPKIEVVLSEAAGLAARRSFVGHASEVISVAYAPDGKTIASGDAGGTLRLWNTATGQTTRVLSGHSDLITSLAFSPDDKQLLSGSYDQTVRLWDVASGKELRTFGANPGYVTSVAFSPDGKTAISGGYNGELILWNVADGRKLTQFAEPGDPVFSVVFSPDGHSILAGAADHRMRQWDIDSQTLARTFEGHTGAVNAVAWSPDGQTIASGSDDHTLRLWDAATGKERGRLLGHDDLVWSVAFSPDSQLIVSSSRDQTMRLWDATTRQELRRFEGHQGEINSAVFSPDGRSIISGSSDRTVRLWDVAPGQQIRQLGGAHQPTIQSVAFSPDGKTAVTSAEDGTLGVWDVGSGQRTRTTPITDDPASISNLVVSPDGSQAYFYTQAGDLSIWDVSSGTEISRTKGFEGENSGPSHVAISPDGNQMVYATSFFSTTSVFYYDWSTSAQKELTGHSADITSLAFSPDGKTAVSGSRDRTIRLWDLANGSTIKSFSGHARAVTSVAFSPDGRTIISGSDDRTIRLWDVETGQEKLRLVGHSGPVTSVALSPDGRSLLSGSDDGTLRLWRVDTLDELTAWVRANRDVPVQPCSVNKNYNLTNPIECVDTTVPTATAPQ